jgi:hypothetical protein
LSIQPSEEAEKERIKRELTALQTQDKVTVILKSALGAIPGVGSAFVELIDAKVPSSTIDRIAGEFAKLQSEASQLRDRISSEYIKTDQAAFIFLDMLEHVRDDYQAEKLDAYRAIFLNSIIDMNASQELKELYLNILDGFTVTHIKMLRFLSNPDAFYRQQNIHQGTQNQGSYMQGLREAFPEYSEDQLRVVWADLRNKGFVGTEASSLTSIISGSASDQLAANLTPFGRGFITFIRSPMPQ